MSKVLDQLRSRWGEYMPEVVLQTKHLIISIFITSNLIAMIVIDDDQTTGVCADQWATTDLSSLHRDFHHVRGGEDRQADHL